MSTTEESVLTRPARHTGLSAWRRAHDWGKTDSVMLWGISAHAYTALLCHEVPSTHQKEFLFGFLHRVTLKLLIAHRSTLGTRTSEMLGTDSGRLKAAGADCTVKAKRTSVELLSFPKDNVHVRIY